jgi:hypothetical protein
MMGEIVGVIPEAAIKQAPEEFDSRTWRPWAVCALSFLALLFVLQVFSPIRLNADAIVLLSVSESAAQGLGFLDQGVKTVFPPGYPAVVAALIRLGLAHSAVLIGLNLSGLAAGLFFSYIVIRRTFPCSPAIALNIILLTLLSWVVVKHSTIPLTDFSFFALCAACLSLMTQAWLASRLRQVLLPLAASWLALLGSLVMRRVGLSLIPALLYAFLSRQEVSDIVRQIPAKLKLLIALCFGMGVIGTAFAISKTSTLSDFSTILAKVGVVRMVLQIVGYRLTDVTELFVNVPITKVPGPLRTIITVLGLFALIAIGRALLLRRKAPAPLDIFLLSYFGILFVWPYSDPRFLIPVVPFLFAYIFTGLPKNNKTILRFAVPSYCAAFAVLGIAALGYSTRITFSQQRFADLYGDSRIRPSYCEAFHTCSAPAGDPKTVRLIQKFN